MPIERRLPLVVRQRAALLEALTPIRRAAFINAWNSPEVTHRMRAGQAFLRAELSAVFAGEIGAAGDGGADLLIALDTILSWASWDHLRTTVALPHDDAVEVVERMMWAVLAAARG